LLDLGDLPRVGRRMSSHPKTGGADDSGCRFKLLGRKNHFVRYRQMARREVDVEVSLIVSAISNNVSQIPESRNLPPTQPGKAGAENFASFFTSGGLYPRSETPMMQDDRWRERPLRPFQGKPIITVSINLFANSAETYLKTGTYVGRLRKVFE